MPSYRHVIFDLDGTLADTAADIVDAVLHTLEPTGRPPLDPGTILSYVGDGARKLMERVLEGASELVEPCLAAFLDYYRDHPSGKSRLYPGMLPTLETLRQDGVRLSVLTNKPTAIATPLLRDLGVDDLFRAIVGFDDRFPRKPDPAGLLWLVSESGVPIRETILVGDTGVDARTARAAGTDFAAVSWGFRPQEARTANPEHWLELPSDLLRAAPPSRGAPSGPDGSR